MVRDDIRESVKLAALSIMTVCLSVCLSVCLLLPRVIIWFVMRKLLNNRGHVRKFGMLSYIYRPVCKILLEIEIVNTK